MVLWVTLLEGFARIASVDELAPVLGRAFDREVLFGCEQLVNQHRHGRISRAGDVGRGTMSKMRGFARTHQPFGRGNPA